MGAIIPHARRRPGRLDRGAALTLSHVARAVRRMLSDVEMFRAMDPAERPLPHFRARRNYLADNLRRLRERLGYAEPVPDRLRLSSD